MVSRIDSLALPASWADDVLPETWPDRRGSLLRLVRWLFRLGVSRRSLAEVPPELLLTLTLPDYVREPFHGLPNGYYSRNVVKGYDAGFELSMLGLTLGARRHLATHLASATRVLDVGCGSGRLAEALHTRGVKEVWGIDPSPYMLWRAQKRLPSLHTVQGLIEKTEFPDACFDGAGAFFVFHELPRDVASGALHELRRILAPSALLCITEPAEEHIRPKGLLQLVRGHGLRALYFHALSRSVYEPFLADWQSIGDVRSWLFAHGFELVKREVRVPFATLVARRI